MGKQLYTESLSTPRHIFDIILQKVVTDAYIWDFVGLIFKFFPNSFMRPYVEPKMHNLV